MIRKEIIWWVPDDKEVWALARQAADPLANGCMKFNLIGNGKQVMMSQELCLATQLSASDLDAAPDDMILLPEVNQASILSCIRTRFNKKAIYTGVGTVLMSVNPFETIPGLYGLAPIYKYMNPYTESEVLAPHVYLVPSRAFADMCRSGLDQSILISGESGAGKTEATKACLSFLTVASEISSNPTTKIPKRDARASILSSGGLNSLGGIAGRVVSASPILEAFGNAKTIRNPNSSRFGKWLELIFDSRNGLSGSVITSYLLEKSRVTRRDPEERSYHIFYQLLRGLGNSELEELQLTRSTSKYRYLERTGTKDEAVDLGDEKHFKETIEAFTVMGFETEEIQLIQRVVAAILHLGNVEFIDKDHGEASLVDPNNTSTPIVASLLGVQQSMLANSLCHRTMLSGTMRRSVITISLNPQMAADTRDTLARALYDKCFLDIINKINTKSGTELTTSSAHYRKKIGLLDIFGFEIFPLNSLEQLCINYCNEMLQNHFNFVIFTAEKNLYAAEGITCNTIEFKDNLPIIQDVDKLFKSLDEEAKIPKGSSKTWYEKLRKAGAGNKASMVVYPPRKDIFTVKHYAGNVDYLPLGCMEKNTEMLTNELVLTMSMSSEGMVQRMFDLSAEEGGAGAVNSANVEEDAKAGAKPAAGGGAVVQKKAQKSISWKFSSQLTSLMTMLKATQSHFIRTIKSNEACRPLVFDAQLVHKQLLYSGVFEVVKIQQSGLPCRIAHADFIDRFQCLAPSSARWKLRSPRELIQTFKAKPLEYDLPFIQLGNSLVFFKTFEQRLLEGKREHLLWSSCQRIQTFFRCRLYFRMFSELSANLKEFHGFCDELDINQARRCLKNVEDSTNRFELMTGYGILSAMYLKRVELTELVRQREALVSEAKSLLNEASESALIRLQEIVARSQQLAIFNHPIIEQCFRLVVNYEAALSFIHQFADEASLSDLTVDEIAIGIETLQSFVDILPQAAPTIDRAMQWRLDVEEELEVTFRQLMLYFEASSMKFDEVLVEMRPFDPNAMPVLSAYHRKLDPTRFKCRDTKDLYEDCDVLIRLVEVIYAAEDGPEAIRIADTYEAHYTITADQLQEFRQWGLIHSSLRKLCSSFQEGRIPGSAVGDEQPVDALTIKECLDNLKILPSPPPQILAMLVVGNWIYKLRDLFIRNEWDELEKLTYTVEEEIQKGYFNAFPESIKEFENCIWLSSYQNALADLYFICNETPFQELPTHSMDWGSLTTTSTQGQLAIDSTINFSTPETSPVLQELIPLAQTILDLRQKMMDMDIESSKHLVASIVSGQHASTVANRDLADAMKRELDACSRLIYIVECEEELNDALLNDQVTVFTSECCDGTSITPPQCAITAAGKSQRLRAAVNKVQAIAAEDRIPVSLVNILFCGEKIVMGREALSFAEEDPTMDWDNIADTICMIPEGNFILDDYHREFNHILLECSRRSIWVGLKKILSSKCVVGTRCIDLKVDQPVFQDCEEDLETLSRRMNDELNPPPGNLMHLLNFVKGMMNVRRALFHRNWPEVYAALANLQPILNDDGLSVPGLLVEVEDIRAEYIAFQELCEMKDALRDILPFISDDISLENKQMRVERLQDAMYLLKKLPGAEAARLVAVADKVVSICIKLMNGEVTSLPEIAVIEAISVLEAEGLSSNEMQQILQFVRLRQILKNICDAMEHNPTSDAIARRLDTVRGDHTMPKELLPWLHAADAYGQLLQAIEHQDWVLIVNRCRALEDIVGPLGSLERHDIKNENTLLELARSRYREGYKLALQIKEDEAQLQASATSSEVPIAEMRRKRLIAEDETNPYGITQLRKAGFTDSKILESSFPLPTLWAFGFDASLLRAKGFGLVKLKSSGYSCAELLTAGFTVDQLAKAGFTSTQLRASGVVSVIQLRDAGFTDALILMAGYDLSSLKAAGFDAPRLAKGGTTINELIAAGFEAKDLRAAGFDAIQIRRAGINDAKKLKDAGFALDNLRAAGFEALELRIAGFDYHSLKSEGFSDIKLLSAGFLHELAHEVLIEFFTGANGKHWKIRLNWCSSKPFREWYGIRTEIVRDSNGFEDEHVVGIDLHDNNLTGSITPRIWLLVHLRYLSLSMNDMKGHIPVCLSQMPSLQLLDLTNNPQLKAPDPNSKDDLGVFDGGLDSSSNQDQNSMPSNSTAGANAVSNEVLQRREVSTLVDLFHTAHGIKWKLKTKWCTPHPLKDWYGISQNKLGFIVQLVLPSNNLHGSVPESIDHLSNLRELDLRFNNLSGSIPTSICNLTRLTHLHLHCNRLSGEIPPAIGNMSNLVVLDLRSNQLTGTLPSTLPGMTNMVYLAVTSNLLELPSKESLRALIPWCRSIVL